ncbi:MAG: TerC family protein [Aureliella sp.]
MIEPIIALVALCLMEIVLGIDNIVFISILTSKLPADKQNAGRKLGLLLALVTRILLLASVFWIAQLTGPIFKLTAFLPIEPLQSYFMEEIPEHLMRAADDHDTGDQDTDHAASASENEEATNEQAPRPEVLDEEAWHEFIEISWRDLILVAGGLFLIYNSVSEIHEEVEDDHGEEKMAARRAVPRFGAVLVQIALMDIVFSIDSVITAVGMADELWVMVTAVIIAVGVMILFANQVGNFVQNNPTIKMLALSFLLLIGVMLVAEGIGTPIAKGYIYFAMAFSLFVEAFNLRIRKKSASATQATS